MSKDYQKTKGQFFIYDPAAGDYYMCREHGVERYTKFQWEAQVYKTLQGAIGTAESLGGGFTVVDKDGKAVWQNG